MINAALNTHDVEISLGFRSNIYRFWLHRPTVVWTLALASWLLLIPLFGWTSATALALSLLLHELGHLVAAKLLGYTVKGMIFIPLVGGAVVVDGEMNCQRNRALITLAGPLVGVLTAVAAYVTWRLTGSVFAESYAAWTVLLTAVNMVPLVPYDGGQAAESLLLPCSVQRSKVLFWGSATAFTVLMTVACGPIWALAMMPVVILLPYAAARKIWRGRDMVEAIHRAVVGLTGSGAISFDALIEAVREFEDEHLLCETVLDAARRASGKKVISTGLDDRQAIIEYLQDNEHFGMSRAWKVVNALLFLLVCGLSFWMFHDMFMTGDSMLLDMIRHMMPNLELNIDPKAFPL
ncbi:metalloprotease [Patescibacteria group bacterium]